MSAGAAKGVVTQTGTTGSQTQQTTAGTSNQNVAANQNLTSSGNVTGQTNLNTNQTGLNQSTVDQLNKLQQSTSGGYTQSGGQTNAGYQSNTGSNTSSGTSSTSLNPALQAAYNQYQTAAQNFYAPNGTVNVPTDPTLQGYFNAAGGALTNTALGNFNAGPVNTNINANYTAPTITTGPQWDAATQAQYMNPYQQSVMAQQQALANQNYQVQEAANNAQYAGQGAYGGSAQALSNATNKNLFNQSLEATQAGELEAGANTAYQEFAGQQQAGLTAQQLQQQGGEFAGEMNLAGQSESGALGLQQQGQNIAALNTIGQAGQIAQALPQQNIANYGAALNKIPTTGTTSTANTGTTSSAGSSGSSGTSYGAGTNFANTTGLSSSDIASLAQSGLQGTQTGSSGQQSQNQQNLLANTNTTGNTTGSNQVNTQGQSGSTTTSTVTPSPLADILSGVGAFGSVAQGLAALKNSGLLGGGGGGGGGGINTGPTTDPTQVNLPSTSPTTPGTPPIVGPNPGMSTGTGDGSAPLGGSPATPLPIGPDGQPSLLGGGGGSAGTSGGGEPLSPGTPISPEGPTSPDQGGGQTYSPGQPIYDTPSPDLAYYQSPAANYGATGGYFDPETGIHPASEQTSEYYGPLASTWEALARQASALGGVR